jgi:GNAT superfamily N-acetyltransferase
MPVREMTAEDIDAVAELRVRAWQSAYEDLLPRPFLDAMSVEEDAARRREMFAKADATVVNLVTESADGTATGWAALGPNRPGGAHTSAEHRPTECAELYAIYVLPGLVGTGLGRALMDSCLERAAQRGFVRVLLWVIEGNTRARRFYERAGFAPDGREDTYEMDGQGTHIPIVRYQRRLPLRDSGSV